MAEEPEGFGARWSRRKRLSQTEESAPDPAPDTAGQEAQDAARLQEEDANRLAAEAVDLDALRYGDDFSVFLKRGVPQMLRRTALRKFFGSDPILANLDGLNDYDDDYNNPAHRVYNSAWDAAKGYAGKVRDLTQEANPPRDPAGDIAGDAPAPQETASEAVDLAAKADGADGAALAPMSVRPPGPPAQHAADPSSAPSVEPPPGSSPDPLSGRAAPMEPAPQEAPRRVSLRRRLEV
ncbi:hypothetical protein U879_20740 [Defluviimonas sp. 20V17]|uniref:DUF3306 domain-containing protein n=1 Tax=Allgaiera indica TaxID=765699 RepID=A0AAN4US59_9RHOB|nr:DUF3306 domain-containing protein [Allgaiera indica]KDB01748.1 hypothetical protein U879_20740 [Defluviimonas sp. 20V17]GHE02514.1 hypothetical protein GCM10008024_22280 [Allgaiera indica]SDX28680.1 Protein of unknown function [Allgaiera indica]